MTTNTNMKKTNAELIQEWKLYEADVTGFQAPVVWDSAKGCIVKDIEQKEYIDWTSGVLVTNVGHCHPHLVEAIQQSSSKLLNNYECPTLERIQAAQKLVNSFPDYLDKCFFLTTGSEAVEAALRLAKRKAEKFEILSFYGGFHGRTMHAASAGGLSGPKKKFGPTLPGFIRAIYPNPYRDELGFCDDAPGYSRYFNYLDDLINANSTGNLAAVLVEPYQGAAGFIFPPEGWLSMLRDWAKQKNMLFILDEVQSSYGRTGKMWAMEHENLNPDIICLGKGIGSGVPVSAVISSSEIFNSLKKGEMSSTFGGNPVSSAAVTAVLEIFENENLVENSRNQGEKLSGLLKEISEKHSSIGDVRGKGLIIGIEIVEDKNSKKPSPEITKKIISECAKRGLLIGSVGIYSNVIRVAPPLVINDDQIEKSVNIFSEVLNILEG